jgi:hypothetical protein
MTFVNSASCDVKMTFVNSVSGDEPAAVGAAVHHSPAGLPSARRPRCHRPHDLSHSDALLRPRQGLSPLQFFGILELVLYTLFWFTTLPLKICLLVRKCCDTHLAKTINYTRINVFFFSALVNHTYPLNFIQNY